METTKNVIALSVGAIMDVDALMDGGTVIVNRKVATADASKAKHMSLAYAIGFADAAARKDAMLGLYAKQLKSGQFRPLVSDIVKTLVPAAAQPWVTATLPPVGPVPKDAFLSLCVKIDACVTAELTKKRLKSPTAELKGPKAFMFGLVKTIVGQIPTDENGVPQVQFHDAAENAKQAGE